MRTLTTDRLMLEPQLAAHADAMYPVLCDPALTAHEGAPPESREWLRERFARLESRAAPDGNQIWLNWVLRLNRVGLVGYVQSTVLPDHTALIAYAIVGAVQRRGLGTEAVRAMNQELATRYGAETLYAVLKRNNVASQKLLQALDFTLASDQLHAEHGIDQSECLMTCPAKSGIATGEAV